MTTTPVYDMKRTLLKDIVRLEQFAKLNAGQIADVWRAGFAKHPTRIGTTLSEESFSRWFGRAGLSRSVLH